MPVERSKTKPKSTKTPTKTDKPASTSTSGTSTTYPLGISFLSASSSLNDSEDMAYIEKRSAHNALERQRREGLNSKFQELAHVLPSLQQVRRPSKSMIVTESLEFVSNAVERETGYKGQLNALRLENAQLLRQASISKKRMRKQIETDDLSNNNKGSNEKPTTTSISVTTKSVAITKPKKLPSKMKPQLRQSSTPIPTSIMPSSSSPSVLVVTDTSLNGNKPSPPVKQKQKKRSREDDEVDHSVRQHVPHDSPPPSSLSTATITETTITEINDLQSPPQVPSNVKRRRCTTDNSATNSIGYQSLFMEQQHHHQQQQQQVSQHRHQRYSSHQSTMVPDNLISPMSSRHNSITPLDNLPMSFNNSTEITSTTIVPSQFDISTTSTSPFGNEHTYYNSFESFDHVVSTVPALRTPIGRNTTSHSTNHHLQLSYDPNTLDIFNSLMDDPNSASNDSNYYWR